MMKLNELQEKIIPLVVEGKKNIEIAEELGFSENWIAKNLKEVYKFFGVANRSSLVREVLSVKNCQ